jgi:hypothetical protein
MADRIGYHGTSKRHHTSLDNGLRRVESAWDPGSGGELGQGFYVANNVDAARLYGYGVCAKKIEEGQSVPADQFIDIWAIYSSIALDKLLHFAVSHTQTWARFPKSYFDNFHFVYLYNDPGFPAPLDPPRRATAAEIPNISQLKFNPNIFPLGVLTLAWSKQVRFADAFG